MEYRWIGINPCDQQSDMKNYYISSKNRKFCELFPKGERFLTANNVIFSEQN